MQCSALDPDNSVHDSNSVRYAFDLRRFGYYLL